MDHETEHLIVGDIRMWRSRLPTHLKGEREGLVPLHTAT